MRTNICRLWWIRCWRFISSSRWLKYLRRGWEGFLLVGNVCDGTWLCLYVEIWCRSGRRNWLLCDFWLILFNKRGCRSLWWQWFRWRTIRLRLREFRRSSDVLVCESLIFVQDSLVPLASLDLSQFSLHLCISSLIFLDCPDHVVSVSCI